VRAKPLAGTLLITAALIRPALAQGVGKFDPGRAHFRVAVNEEHSDYSVMSFFAMPGEDLKIAAEGESGRAFALSEPGAPPRIGARWTWTAPSSPGLYVLGVRDTSSDEAMTLNIFVRFPLAAVKKGWLNGYRIGSYPNEPLRGNPIYAPPPGLVEVKAGEAETAVSPHFRLAQFLCKQTGAFPKYIALRTTLLRKLELILEKLNDAGVRTDALFVMSGYRTPFYNAAIGDVPYSRHMWGDAADIFVDRDHDWRMDDINFDNHADDGDADTLFQFIDRMSGKSWYRDFTGGLGLYHETKSHPAFVHVDCRGFRARW